MDVIVVVSGEYGLAADEIAHAWNTDEANTRTAVARAVDGRLEHYGIADILGAAVVVLNSVTMDLAASLIADRIRSIVAPRARGREIHYTEVVKPDGTRIVELRLTER